ncbi:MAG: IS1182 family transposase [Deltaproteobacteria bacterium]|nr:IS1182 family transposase [Deltaproteobacteria bacterium]MBI3058745.1 IS1182 family transposase [Deltaproteobacteria bacterium]
MSYIEGESRNQSLLFPEILDDYIIEDNLVRFIDAFVDGLKLEEMGFIHSVPESTGRPPYDPRDLLKLYVYGYINGIRSSRRLERECGRNVEVMWLLRKLRPDFKTIADFRKDNRNAFKGVFRQFTLLCKEMDLLGGELVAIDGSKFKAVNSSDRNFSRGKLERKIKEIEEKIEKYLDEMDRADAQEGEAKEAGAEGLKEKVEKLRERKGRYDELLKELERSGESQISLTDPDSRAMPKTPKGDVSYNVQVAVDSKHHLMVEQEVTNAVIDSSQLFFMAKRAKAMLGKDQLTVVADKGYYHGDEVKACEEAGITPYIQKANTSANTALGLFGKERFVYDPKQDCYRCPAGERLRYHFDSEELGRKIRYYWTTACNTCEIKARCTRNKGFRRITRWVHEDILEQMEERVKANWELMKKRKQIVEHPFGTIKFWNDQRHFLMRRLEKVKAEFSLSTLAYNIKRAINLVGVAKLVAAVS